MSRPPVCRTTATTPVDRRVLERMLPFFTERSATRPRRRTSGDGAQKPLSSRDEVAALIGASPREIYFTSGATNRTTSPCRAYGHHGCRGRVVVSAIDTNRLEGADRLSAPGAHHRRPGRPRRRDDLEALAQVVGPETAVISVMAANGGLASCSRSRPSGHRPQGRRAVPRGCGAGDRQDPHRRRGDADRSAIAHRPQILRSQGCGAIYIRKQTTLDPLIVGGGQERGMRSGTLNMPGIVRLGAACAICRPKWPRSPRASRVCAILLANPPPSSIPSS